MARRQSVLTLSVPTPVAVAVGVLTDTAARHRDARLELKDGVLVVTIPGAPQAAKDGSATPGPLGTDGLA